MKCSICGKEMKPVESQVEDVSKWVCECGNAAVSKGTIKYENNEHNSKPLDS